MMKTGLYSARVDRGARLPEDSGAYPAVRRPFRHLNRQTTSADSRRAQWFFATVVAIEVHLVIGEALFSALGHKSSFVFFAAIPTMIVLSAFGTAVGMLWIAQFRPPTAKASMAAALLWTLPLLVWSGLRLGSILAAITLWWLWTVVAVAVAAAAWGILRHRP
jgi:hypothetical protein